MRRESASRGRSPTSQTGERGGHRAIRAATSRWTIYSGGKSRRRATLRCGNKLNIVKFSADVLHAPEY